jgi:hypothetical protein
MPREETTPQSRKKNGSLTALDRLGLVCPLPDCFQKSKGCLHRSENRDQGIELIKIGEPDENS